MRKYELMMILSPDLTEEARSTVVTAIESELKDGGTNIISTDEWGVRDLAYTIHGSGTGYYILWMLEGDGKNFIEATKMFNIKKDIWRYIFVRVDEDEDEA